MTASPVVGGVDSDSDELKTLFPTKEVVLLDGRRVKIEPWGLETGMLLGPRVAALVVKLQKADAANVAQLISDNQRDVVDIIRETLGWSDDEIKTIHYEDLFVLAQAVIEVCVVTADGGGPLGKAMALAGYRSAPASRADSSRKPSSSSSPTVTLGAK